MSNGNQQNEIRFTRENVIRIYSGTRNSRTNEEELIQGNHWELFNEINNAFEDILHHNLLGGNTTHPPVTINTSNGSYCLTINRTNNGYIIEARPVS